jgi:hypothetical protein
MQRLPGPTNPLERFLGLLGAGILGTISFVLISILLLPVLIIMIPYMLYVRWKMKRQMANMVEQMQQAFGGLGGMGIGAVDADAEPSDGETVENGAPAGSRGRKRVDVTVKTVGFEDNPAEERN